MGNLIHRLFFVLRHKSIPAVTRGMRKSWFSMQGMHIGKGTVLSKIYVTWPHQVYLGNNCLLEDQISFKFDGIWEKGPSIRISNDVFIGAGCEFNIRAGIDIGRDSLIASGCKFIDHDHGIATAMPMRMQDGPEKEIIIGNDVWLGCNVIVLKGVEIGDGVIVAAGAVVTKSISSREIWAGVPAKKIGQRT